MYKCMIKKGLNTLKNEASKRIDKPNESVDHAHGDSNNRKRKRNKQKNNHVFAQSNKVFEN